MTNEQTPKPPEDSEPIQAESPFAETHPSSQQGSPASTGETPDQGAEANVISAQADSNGESTEGDEKGESVPQRPHALDEDADDWVKPRRSLFTLRNMIAVFITLFVSLLLAILVGLPYSPGAMIGVFIATALLFGPLWFALTHQPYEKRLQRPKVSQEQSDSESGADKEAAVSTPVMAALAPNASGPVFESAAVNTSPLGRSMPAREPLRAYYVPSQRLQARAGVTLARRTYPIIVVFGLFVAVILIATPFLASAMLDLWGKP